MAQYNDPRLANYGRANYGQLVPNRTAQLRQPEMSQPQQPSSPMTQSLMPQQAPQQPAKQPSVPKKSLAATGTFGPKTFTQNLPTRGQTDFSRSPNKLDGGMNMLKSMPGTTGALAPFGIGRRASGSQNDLSVDNAKQGLQNAYQSILGRPGSDEEYMTHLQNQGLKPGDKWVGQKGFDSIIESLRNSPEHEPIRLDPSLQAPKDPSGMQMPTDFRPSGFEQERGTGEFAPETPMAGALDASPAKSAYQEYLSEFGPDDPEQPVPYEVFQQAFDSMPETEMSESLWNPETREAVQTEQGRFGWNNINLNPVEQAGGSRFEGFNDDRALAGEDTKSIKDTFRRVVGGLGIDLTQFKTMDEVESMLKSQVVPALQAAGVKVLDVQTDKILVETFERGPEWVDVVGDATGMDPRWWWGADDVGGGTAQGGPIDPWSFLNGDDEGRRSEGDEPSQQSALMDSFGLGGGDWQSFLDMLMQQVR